MFLRSWIWEQSTAKLYGPEASIRNVAQTSPVPLRGHQGRGQTLRNITMRCWEIKVWVGGSETLAIPPVSCPPSPSRWKHWLRERPRGCGIFSSGHYDPQSYPNSRMPQCTAFLLVEFLGLICWNLGDSSSHCVLSNTGAMSHHVTTQM